MRTVSAMAIFHQLENLQTRQCGDLARKNELLNAKLFRDRWVMNVAEAVLYFIPAASPAACPTSSWARVLKNDS